MRTLITGVAAAVVVLAVARPAAADAKADVRSAFEAFVDAYASPKPALGKLELLFEPPMPDYNAPAVPDAVEQGLQQPKVKLVRVVMSPGDKSAWVAAEIRAKVSHDDQWSPQTVRASAVLVTDGATWRVIAADFSVAVHEAPAAPGCGNASHQWVASAVAPKAMAQDLRAWVGAFEDAPAFAALMSDSKDALLWGTSPGEMYAGGAAIKKIFRTWHVSVWLDDDLHAFANVTPDGQLAWFAVPITAPIQMCSMYRGFFVLAKEPNGWRLVHQHYSLPYR